MSPLLLVLLGLLVLVLLRGRTRRVGEPPLITGWIPYLGKALEFRKDAHAFLEEQRRRHGDVFTVYIKGNYMTFIMNPLMYPNIIKHGRQLDFHKFTNVVAPYTFGYPPVDDVRFPGLGDKISSSFHLLQGSNLTLLTESMMANLMAVFRQDYLNEASDHWRTGLAYDFCTSVMFEATFLTMYGRPPSGWRHPGMGPMKDDFLRFDTMFPLLIAQTPLWLLGNTEATRLKLINHFLPQKMSQWSNRSKFIQQRAETFDQYDTLKDMDKAAHHFAILWAAVGNTAPATFWSMYYLMSHPEALQTVRQEIQDVLNQSGVQICCDRDIVLSRDQLDRLLYLESAINESLRLSTASMNIRVVEEDFHLRLDSERSVAVRKGDIIALYPQSVHMDPEVYEDPQSFRFDRFLVDGRERTDFYKDGQRLKFYLMPFGSGSTMCPGRHFAINEIKQFLCLLLVYFDLDLDHQQRTTLDCSRAGLGILQPTKDVHFRYRLRTATDHHSPPQTTTD
ncbi:25-hydroxycholesterol 7-alpha-hydroxylase [Sphaeramia orbicularis]|uniref:25-hydroxycholesterol 7-alpha-hydroxylase-like n=1 Tax=Sphaeramia orbicularis TaxID=375764 RepID=A0A673BXY1_9TELE|nr:25-hydroxycholesterol 7-alpha-hydroxylase-like [Sphaeramia orbicularis]